MIKIGTAFAILFSAGLLAQPEQLRVETAAYNSLNERVNGVLEANKALPEVAKLKKQGVVPNVALFRGYGMKLYSGTTPTLPELGAKALEIEFFDGSQFGNPRVHGRLVFFDPEWKALFVYTGFGDERWLNAAILGGYHMASTMKAGQPPRLTVSPEYEAKLNLEMHVLMKQSLDKSTGGLYRKKLRELVVAELRSADDAVSLPPAKFRPLENLFIDPSPEEVNFRQSQYSLALLDEWFRGKVPANKLPEERLKAYLRLVRITIH